MVARSKMTAVAQLLVWLALWTSLNFEAVAFPSGQTSRCRRSSPSLDDCVRAGLTTALQYFKTGSVELGVPPLEPLEIPLLELRSDEQTNLTLELVLRDVLVRGLTDTVFAKVSTTLEEEDVRKLEVTSKTPALRVSAQYHSEGLLVNFPLHSAGALDVNMTEVTSSWVVYLREEVRNNVTYLQVDGLDIDMMPIGISFSPVDQLNDDNRLGEAVNIILKENSHEIYSIIKGRLAAVFGDVLTELTNTALRQVPESWYLGP